jgi:hypothetical protein
VVPRKDCQFRSNNRYRNLATRLSGFYFPSGELSKERTFTLYRLKNRQELHVLSLTNRPHLVNYGFHQSTLNILDAPQTPDVRAVVGSEVAEGIEVIGI